MKKLNRREFVKAAIGALGTLLLGQVELSESVTDVDKKLVEIAEGDGEWHSFCYVYDNDSEPQQMTEAEKRLADGEWHHTAAVCCDDNFRTWLNIDGDWYDADGNPTWALPPYHYFN